ncbi:MAG TPA: T9SS type A sorting domain-containing protein, partial [Candidatus Acidoferrales bacterium]|nr:T9SS type A sorting domain-containing protein [Candidatus Acidoferrales bacterium]
ITTNAQVIPRQAQITVGEYFVGSDPGVGNGTPISISSPSTTITSAILNLHLATNQLIHFRFKNTNGIWSVPRSITFTGTGVNRSAFVSYVEYFVGPDPGAGNGTSVSITSAANVPFNLSSVSLSQGQFVHLRVKDDQGRWSAPAELMYPTRSIAAAEVVIGNNPNAVALGYGIPMTPTSGSFGKGIVTVQANELSWNHTDTIWVRARTSQYLWSKPTGSIAMMDTTLRPVTLFTPSDYDTVQLFYPTRPIVFSWSRSATIAGISVEYSLHLEGTGLDTTFTNLQDTSLTSNLMPVLNVSSNYDWSVTATDGYTVVSSLSSFSFRTSDKVTAVDNSNQLPKSFALYQNYPNPFNPSTNIMYDLPQKSHVMIVVYDVLGREVRILVDEEKPAGSYRVIFDASNLPSGVYFYKLIAGNFVSIRKLMVIK